MNAKPFYQYPTIQKIRETTDKTDSVRDWYDGNDDFSQENLQGFVKESPFAPVLFVIDFDNTLAVYDEMYVLDNTSTNKLPSTYTRPFMYEFLDFIKTVNTNNVVIMWTAGTDLYIKQNLLLLNIAQYFDKVLSREHCNESKKEYDGKCKSHAYLVSRFPKYKRMRSILVDNLAYKNGADTGYSEILSIRPYNLWDVMGTYGAFGVSPSNIADAKQFLLSKGTRGTFTSKRARGQNRIQRGKVRNNCRGDTALLRLIYRLQKRFFPIYDEKRNDGLSKNLSIQTEKDERLKIVEIRFV